MIPINSSVSLEAPTVPTAVDIRTDVIKISENRRPFDVRTAVIGNVDSGKSTLVGVLTRNVLDNGRGSARAHVFNFSHEAANGRTSSIAQELIGFDADLNQILPQVQGRSANAWTEVVQKSETCVTLLDLCGHEKYLRTTLFGLAGMAPDFAIVVVGANQGVLRMTKEHLGVALALNVPLIIVVTKVDFAPEEVRTETIRTLQKILKSPAAGKLPILVKSEADAETVAANFSSGRLAPIFPISSVSGVGLDALRRFLSMSRPRESARQGGPLAPSKVSIDGVYQVTGVGTVVAGTVLSGTVKIGQTLMLGPDGYGEYRPVTIRSVHHRRVPVDCAYPGDGISCAIKQAVGKENKDGQGRPFGELRKTHVRKGQHLVDASLKQQAALTFAVEVSVLHHATTMSPGYQAVVHCGVSRQVAKVLHVLDPDSLPEGSLLVSSTDGGEGQAGGDEGVVSQGSPALLEALATLPAAPHPNHPESSLQTVKQWGALRSGERAVLVMRFVYRPELLQVGAPLLLREGKTRAIGRVVAVNPPGFPLPAAMAKEKGKMGRVREEGYQNRGDSTKMEHKEKESSKGEMGRSAGGVLTTVKTK